MNIQTKCYFPSESLFRFKTARPQNWTKEVVTDQRMLNFNHDSILNCFWTIVIFQMVVSVRHSVDDSKRPGVVFLAVTFWTALSFRSHAPQRKGTILSREQRRLRRWEQTAKRHVTPGPLNRMTHLKSWKETKMRPILPYLYGNWWFHTTSVAQTRKLRLGSLGPRRAQGISISVFAMSSIYKWTPEWHFRVTSCPRAVMRSSGFFVQYLHFFLKCCGDSLVRSDCFSFFFSVVCAMRFFAWLFRLRVELEEAQTNLPPASESRGDLHIPVFICCKWK